MYSRAYCLDPDCDWQVESDTVDPAIDAKAAAHTERGPKHGTVSGMVRKSEQRPPTSTDNKP